MFLTKLNRRLHKRPMLGDERGLSTVEYVIILCVIAVAAIGVWGKFGDAIVKKVQGSTHEIDSMGAADSK